MHWRSRSRSRSRALATAAGTLMLAACTPAGAPVRVVIPAGATFRAAADSLASAHVIRSARLFRWYAALTHHDRAIKPGTYVLRPGTGWSAALDALVEGSGLVHSLTIPEGWDLTSIVPALAQTLSVPPESVAVAVRDSALLDSVGAPPDAGTLEAVARAGYTLALITCSPAGLNGVPAGEAVLLRHAADGWRKRSLLLHRLRLHSLLLADLPVLRSLFPLWPQQQMRWMAPAHGI